MEAGEHGRASTTLKENWQNPGTGGEQREGGVGIHPWVPIIFIFLHEEDDDWIQITFQIGFIAEMSERRERSNLAQTLKSVP